MEFEVVNHGIDNSQYFQGCGTYGTQFEYCVTGAGISEYEAFEDAMDQIIHDDLTTGEFIDNLHSAIFEKYGKPSEDQIPWEEFGVEFNDDGDPIDDEGEITDYPDLYYYISIRYNV